MTLMPGSDFGISPNGDITKLGNDGVTKGPAMCFVLHESFLWLQKYFLGEMGECMALLYNRGLPGMESETFCEIPVQFSFNSARSHTACTGVGSLGVGEGGWVSNWALRHGMGGTAGGTLVFESAP